MNKKSLARRGRILFSLTALLYYYAAVTNPNDRFTEGVFSFFRDNPAIGFRIERSSNFSFEESDQNFRLHVNVGEYNILYYSDDVPRYENNSGELRTADYYNISQILSSLPNYSDIEMRFTERLNAIDQTMKNFDRQIDLIEIRFNRGFPSIEHGRNRDGLNILIEFQGERYRINENNSELSISRDSHPHIAISNELIQRFARYAEFLSNYELVDRGFEEFYDEVERFVDLITKPVESEELALH